MRRYFAPALSSAIAAMIFLTGCNGGNTENSAEEISVTETSFTESISETAAEISAIPEESETAEASAETEPEAAAEPKSYEPYQIKLYNSLGTGIPRPDNYGEDRIRYRTVGNLEDMLSLLKDKDVSEKIRSGVGDWLNFLEENYNYSHKQLANDKLFYTYCSAYNGFLFYEKKVRSSDEGYYAAFDLRTGERLELSDMFFEGDNFLDKLNWKLWSEFQKLTYLVPYDYEPVDYLPMKREFVGLTENGFYFGPHEFYFPVSNPYFSGCEQIYIDLFDFDTVLNVPYDMTELFEDGADELLKFYIEKYVFSTSYFSQSGNIDIYLLDKSPKLTEEQREFLNNNALSLTSSEFLDTLRERGWNIYSADEPPVYHIYTGESGTEYKYKDIFTIDIDVINDDFVEICLRQSNVFEAPNPKYSLYFDLKTFEPFDTEQLFERVFGDEEYVWSYVAIYSLEDTLENNNGFIRNEAPDISRLRPEDISCISTSELYYYGNVDGCYVYGYINAAN